MPNVTCSSALIPSYFKRNSLKLGLPDGEIKLEAHRRLESGRLDDEAAQLGCVFLSHFNIGARL